MNRHEYRLKMIETFYQHYLLKKTLIETVQDYLSDVAVDEYFKKILKYYIKHQDTLINKINNLLVNWEFDRLNYVSQAIMTVACIELEINQEDKAVIINEAILFAKQYVDLDDYKFINGVLDKYEQTSS